ncbi:hypothetical protein [Desulfovibrio sp. SGI.169]|uniref:hypothetical protein n=1 Tax=Desulfovibrio sp. SGI.169 TaxID=3420561 RepID=UPI003D000198
MRLKAREKDKKTVLFFLEQYVPAAIGLEDEKVQKRNCPYLSSLVRIYPVRKVVNKVFTVVWEKEEEF